MCHICDLKPSILNNMININYKNCNKIKNTNHLKSAIIVSFENCKELEFIDNNKNIKYISVTDCIKLKTITNVPELTELRIFNCFYLQNIPNSVNIEYLQICTTSINKLGTYPKLKKLYMYNNNNLQYIEDQPSVTEFSCEGALNISRIGIMPKIKKKYIAGCPIIKNLDNIN